MKQCEPEDSAATSLHVVVVGWEAGSPVNFNSISGQSRFQKGKKIKPVSYQ